MKLWCLKQWFVDDDERSASGYSCGMVEFDAQVILAALQEHKGFPLSTATGQLYLSTALKVSLQWMVMWSSAASPYNAFSSEQKASLVHHLIFLKVGDFQSRDAG